MYLNTRHIILTGIAIFSIFMIVSIFLYLAISIKDQWSMAEKTQNMVSFDENKKNIQKTTVDVNKKDPPRKTLTISDATLLYSKELAKPADGVDIVAYDDKTKEKTIVNLVDYENISFFKGNEIIAIHSVYDDKADEDAYPKKTSIVIHDLASATDKILFETPDKYSAIGGFVLSSDKKKLAITTVELKDEHRKKDGEGIWEYLDGNLFFHQGSNGDVLKSSGIIVINLETGEKNIYELDKNYYYTPAEWIGNIIMLHAPSYEGVGSMWLVGENGTGLRNLNINNYVSSNQDGKILYVKGEKVFCGVYGNDSADSVYLYHMDTRLAEKIITNENRAHVIYYVVKDGSGFAYREFPVDKNGCPFDSDDVESKYFYYDFGTDRAVQLVSMYDFPQYLDGQLYSIEKDETLGKYAITSGNDIVDSSVNYDFELLKQPK